MKEVEKRDIREEVTNKIIDALERGVMPWRRPWSAEVDGKPFGLPQNAVTGRAYTGGNRLLLLLSAEEKGYQDNRWLTFKQAQGLGGSVMKGEKGTAIEYWEHVPFWKRRGMAYEYLDKPARLGALPAQTRPEKVRLDDGREVKTSDVTVVHDGKRYTWRQAENDLSTLVSKSHVVFNVCQCHGLNIEPLEPQPPREISGAARALVVGMMRDGVQIAHGGSSAYYSCATDRVVVPKPEQFTEYSKYLGTLLHELGHATGHEKRLNRQLGNAFGSEAYAREELVAELASSFLAAETGIGFDDQDHAAYIGSWLEVLKKDKHEVFRAAKEASQAADYIIEKGKDIHLSQEREQVDIPDAPHRESKKQRGAEIGF